MSSQEFFTPVAFDFLWESAHLGDLPYPLRVASHGETEDERSALRARVDTELNARGIWDSTRRIEPRMEAWLGLLAQAPMSIDALHIPDFQAPPLAALAASDGREAVLVVQDSDGVWIRPAYPDGLSSAIVELLPAAPRGTAASITLPLDEALRTAPSRQAVGAGAGQQPAEDAGGSGKGKPDRKAQRQRSLADRPSDPRHAYSELTGQPRLRGGQLAANSRDGLGGKQRSGVLAWFDTVTGRYLSLSRAGTDGREWVTISPADAKTLRNRLGEMLASVAFDR